MIGIEDIIPAAPCEVQMARKGDTFEINIVGDGGYQFQELSKLTVLDGDTVSISGLGFKVTFDGVEWTPPMPEKSSDDYVPPNITLKRKMDIDNGKA